MSDSKIPFLSLKDLNAPYIAEMQEAATRVIASGWYLHGPETETFEAELAASCGAAGAVAVSNGLDALRLILRAYIQMGRLKPGDEVIVPANTYIASILAITDAGLTPVPVEPDPTTLNLDPENVEEAITPRTRAIMVVHLYGRPCWNEQLKMLARRLHLHVIEDNAQAIGARAVTTGLSDKSNVTGALGDAAAFSFYPTKNIGALGDSGAVTSDDPKLLDTVRALANYGSDRRYHNIYQGFNCRMDELQAAMLRVKLRHIDHETERRNLIAEIYTTELAGTSLVLPRHLPGETHVWHQYVVLCEDRDGLQQRLAQQGIGTDIHYAVPPHRQPCYADTLGQKSYPITETLADMVLSLPIGSISPDQARIVAEACKNAGI